MRAFMNSSILAAAGAFALAGGLSGVAHAGAHTEQCFDKDTLTYVDCPSAPAPVVAPPPVVPVVEDESGFYLGLKGGLAWFTDTDFNIANVAVGNVDNEYDLGYFVGGQIGYEFDDPFARFVDVRIDLEAGYMAADIDNHTLNGGANLAGPTGDTSVFSLMTNIYLDYNVTSRFDVFVGGGAGIGFVNFDGHGVTATGQLMDDDDVAFGYHFDAGVSYDLTDNIILEASYRYTNFVDADLRSTANGGALNSSVNVDAHQALAGVRLKF